MILLVSIANHAPVPISSKFSRYHVCSVAACGEELHALLHSHLTSVFENVEVSRRLLRDTFAISPSDRSPAGLFSCQLLARTEQTLSRFPCETAKFGNE